MCKTSMFSWVVGSGLACALMLGGLHPAAAQTTKRSGSSPEVRRLSLVIGGGVRIAKGVSIGKIEDVVLNDDGCIDYVVVVYRDKYVAIPWSVATVDYSGRIVTVDITEQRFAEVPTFTRTEFSVLTTTEFSQKVHTAFGGKAGAKAESPKGEPKPAKSASTPEPTKATEPDKPKAESQDKPKGEPADKPKAESTDKPKVDKPKAESADKPKVESKDKPKGEPVDKPKAESKDKPKELGSSMRNPTRPKIRGETQTLGTGNGPAPGVWDGTTNL